MTGSRTKLLMILLSMFISIGLCGITCRAQSNEHLYVNVPNNLRERFVKRLNMLIEYEKAQRWENLYGLLYSGLKQNETVDQYSKRRKHWQKQFPESQVLDFTLKSLSGPDNPDTGEWFIFGCITLSEKGLIKKYEGMIGAYYEKDNWFFSEPLVIVGVDGPATECDISR